MRQRFFFQAEDGIRDKLVTGVQTVLFRSSMCAGCARQPGQCRGGEPAGPAGGAAGASPVAWRKIGRASWRERVLSPVVLDSSIQKIHETARRCLLLARSRSCYLARDLRER